ncbi:MAG: hypothetical protein KatS3mg077_1217 [Candidatus Binatia bacterium]|nr:MAG: hypothetical protein KatS3mg077_1217 [Candidatus Binatia bacterium]
MQPLRSGISTAALRHFITSMSRRALAAGTLATALLFALVSYGSEPIPPEGKVIQQGGEVFPAVAWGVFDGSLRDLPLAPTPEPGAPPIEQPDGRCCQAQQDDGSPMQAETSLRQPQGTSAVAQGGAAAFSPPELNFPGQGYTDVRPPDTVGDVGLQYYVQAVNHSQGTSIAVYDKVTGALSWGPTVLRSLWTAGGNCATAGRGDPIVLYDHLANRWLIAEFVDPNLGNTLCVYLSRTDDPLNGGWFFYEFHTPQFPDYPKFAVWPDAYYVTTNERPPAVYALDRARMLAGLPASQQRFTAEPLGGFTSFQALTPADLHGAAPPAGSPGLFVRHRDDEVHDSEPVAGVDFLDLFELRVDFAAPQNSRFTALPSVEVAQFDSRLCGVGSVQCIPQPGTSQSLDPVSEVVMWRAQ